MGCTGWGTAARLAAEGGVGRCKLMLSCAGTLPGTHSATAPRAHLTSRAASCLPSTCVRKWSGDGATETCASLQHASMRMMPCVQHLCRLHSHSRADAQVGAPHTAIRMPQPLLPGGLPLLGICFAVLARRTQFCPPLPAIAQAPVFSLRAGSVLQRQRQRCYYDTAQPG